MMKLWEGKLGGKKRESAFKKSPSHNRKEPMHIVTFFPRKSHSRRGLKKKGTGRLQKSSADRKGKMETGVAYVPSPGLNSRGGT